MAKLLTMPDLSWTVHVDRWTWVYTFSHLGSVTWRDPWNGMHGRGTWLLKGDKLLTRWSSKTTEEWDMPLDPEAATGTCFMEEGTFDLNAVARDFFLEPGDVVHSGSPIIRGNGTHATVIYADEVRTGGTVAWISKNPGNIREGERYGAFKGKYLYVKDAWRYAIFPDETTGLMAVIAVLRGYGRVTIAQAMARYANKGDGHNDPNKYAAVLAAGLKTSVDTFLTSFSDEQMMRMATLMTGVETTTPGTSYARGDPSMPFEIAQRLR